MPAYAHSRNIRGEYHDLVEHLQSVASKSAEFAAPFGATELGYYLGLWHDLGKFHPAWQQYLLDSEAGLRKRGGPDHKAAGVSMLRQYEAVTSAMLCLQGHHGGLRMPSDLKTWFREKATGAQLPVSIAQDTLSSLEPSHPLRVPPFIGRDKLALEFFLRFLFSALVDADVLDTEQHKHQDRAQKRASAVSLTTLLLRLEARLAQFGQPETVVNEIRAQILEACRRTAETRPGLFRLTVPTGGGKTLAGMAFALLHALEHGRERVIVAVPYMTITEQTAAVYRAIFEHEGENVVLEHHSGAAEQGGVGEEDDEHSWQRLAAENWDAPIVVTTTVQLFESLFANRTSRCRKLHRLARSVILLDEARPRQP